jgi:hypothetical protein
MNCPVPRQRVGLRHGMRLSGDGAAPWDKIDVFSGPVPVRPGRMVPEQTGPAGREHIESRRISTSGGPGAAADPVHPVAAEDVPGPAPRNVAVPRTVRRSSSPGILALPWYHRTWSRTLVPLLLAIVLLVILAAAVNSVGHRWVQRPVPSTAPSAQAQTGP